MEDLMLILDVTGDPQYGGEATGTFSISINGQHREEDRAEV